MIRSTSLATSHAARLTLRAHANAPARVEYRYNPTSARLLKAVLWLLACWGAIPFLLWIPPHYPWVLSAFVAGVYLCQHSWRGRYTIRSFAGVCPRCGAPIRLGVDRTVNLPHTLTCFACHFEPRLELDCANADISARPMLGHQKADCVGRWTIRWLADEPFVFCEDCFAGMPATRAAREAADRDNANGDLLDQLSDEGWPLI